MWFSAEIIFSKQQQKHTNIFGHISEVSDYLGEVTTKESMRASEPELEMERGSL